ncbi:hypothetical protein GE253_10925 [Niveispirillum sp. SYP-B3756]|uniref:hypothetical protein n=1 Tax=Niveispirillum sp. SYP-B3756 TaxID=2662178 RepID=UPI001291C28B|nr:hypothetical protein [Niveispirillum sp. SYP-B3756]MQP65853.1 hypothetical protein [Niveispirillum sp. SYP-B3756]
MPAMTLTALLKKIARQMTVGTLSPLPPGLSEQLLEVPELLEELLFLFSEEFEKPKPNRKLLALCSHLLGDVMMILAQLGKKGAKPARHLRDQVRQMLEEGLAGPEFALELLRTAQSTGFDLEIDLTGEMQDMAPAVPSTPENPVDQIQALVQAFTGLLAEAQGDIFAAYEQIAPLITGIPAEARSAMGDILLTNPDSTPLRELALAWLLDPDAGIRQQAVSLLQQTAEKGVLPPNSLRRLILLRNMLPDSLRAGVDATIRAARLKGIECPPSGPGVVPEAVFASGFDGAGAQSLFMLLKQGRKYVIVSLLFKHGVGIRDAWCGEAMTRKAATAMLDQIDEQLGLLESNVDYLTMALGHFLAVGADAETPPPFSLLSVLETLALPPPAPAIRDTENLLEALLPANQPADIQAQALAGSADWVNDIPLTLSWFEDVPAVDDLLRGRRLGVEKQRTLILTQLLPQRRNHWARLLAWTATTGKGDWNGVTATDMALVARSLLTGADLDTIPVMADIAQQTVLAWRSANGKG